MTDQIPKPVDDTKKQLAWWLTKLQVETVKHHRPVLITREDEEALEKAIAGIENLITQEKQNLLDEVAEQAKEQNTFASPTTYVPLSTIEELRRKV